jgi:hypothetical protein
MGVGGPRLYLAERGEGGEADLVMVGVPDPDLELVIASPFTRLAAPGHQQPEPPAACLAVNPKLATTFANCLKETEGVHHIVNSAMFMKASWKAGVSIERQQAGGNSRPRIPLPIRA